MICLVRHGQTDDNLKKIFTGDNDVPLNETGFKQAKETAEKLRSIHFDLCFCSPLLRAKQTANEILRFHPNLPIIFDERLKERDAELKGKSVLKFDHDRWQMKFDKDNKFGESIMDCKSV